MSSHASYFRQLEVVSNYNAPISDDLMERITASNQVLLPPEVLAEVVNLDDYSGRMNFRISSADAKVWAGMLEATARKNSIVMSLALMDQLRVNDRDTVRIEYVVLPRATELVLRAEEEEFYLLANPRVLLERELQNHTLLYRNQNIQLRYLDNVFTLTVVRLFGMTEDGNQPVLAADIVNADINLEFENEPDLGEPIPDSAISGPTMAIPAMPDPTVPMLPVIPSQMRTSLPPRSDYIFPGIGRLVGERSTEDDWIAPVVPVPAPRVPPVSAARTTRPSLPALPPKLQVPKLEPAYPSKFPTTVPSSYRTDPSSTYQYPGSGRVPGVRRASPPRSVVRAPPFPVPGSSSGSSSSSSSRAPPFPGSSSSSSRAPPFPGSSSSSSRAPPFPGSSASSSRAPPFPGSNEGAPEPMESFPLIGRPQPTMDGPVPFSGIGRRMRTYVPTPSISSYR